MILESSKGSVDVKLTKTKIDIEEDHQNNVQSQNPSTQFITKS